MNRSPSRTAIVGIGCRFPGGARDPESFWELLNDGTDPISRLPQGRFDVDRFLDPTPGTPGRLVTADGGFLDDIDRFDAAFFGLSPREARKIDPQHRLLMEVVWEALEDAGIPPASLAGRRVGVYAGVWSGEYENVMYRTPEDLDFHAITGGGRYAASGRISFALDLRGPAFTVDSGCSASLVALHLARQAVESGEVEVAIAAAANLVLQPQVNIGYSRSGMLSAGARCRFGDDGAAGYVRSDGVGAVVLKPLERAREDDDRVRGVLLATAVNADGKGSGQLATPSSDAQAELLSTVYSAAGIDPATVPYVEAHGTGTKAGDPVELSALGRILGQGRAADDPLIVGSVKTVIGHTEAAAGMAGLIKTLLALEHRQIPANLHLRTPSEAIAWDEMQVRVPTAATPWPADAPLVAGVSSFGITGTNAHAVVAAAEQGDEEPRAAATGPAIVTLSARSEEALTAAASNLRAWLDRPEIADLPSLLPDLAYTTTCRRDAMSHRLAIVADEATDVAAALDEHLAGEASARVALGTAVEGETPRVAFVFSGQGSQWLGMGRELLASAPAFAATVDRCDALLRQRAGWSLREALDGQVEGAFERVDLVQPVLTCVQIALADQLRAWGITPEAVVGHSMGEVAAAYVAGALTLEDAVHVIVTRSRLLARIAGAGAMALVDLPEDELAKLLEETNGAVSVASVNGPRSTVMSGDPEVVDALLARLDAEGVFCRRVRVDVASHSAQTDPLLGPLRDELAPLNPRTPELAFHSTARAGAATDLLLDSGYWVDNLRQPVQLMGAVSRMVAAGIDTFVEVAPHPVLLSSLADIAAEAGKRVRTMAGPRREEPEMRRTLDLLARLHVSGAGIDWRTLVVPGARQLRLPAYPWQRERHWLERWEDWSGADSGTRSATPRPERTDELAYVVAWRPIEPAAAPIAGERWAIIGDPDGLGSALAARLRAAGGTVELAVDEPLTGEGALAGVIDLRAVGLSASAPDGFDAAMSDAFAGATATVRTLLDRRVVPTRGTWLVTRGAQAPGERSARVESAPQGVVWGIARTSAAEHPELKLRVVDLDPAEGPAVSAAALEALLTSGSDEDQVALAGAVPHAARLSRAAPDELRTPVQWRQDAAYLVTGGLGDLGLLVAEEMVRGGARRLILSGRSAIPPRAEWAGLREDAPLRLRLERVRALERQGASVHLASFDVGSAESLERFLAGYEAEGWPPIAGVVHCAGVFDAGAADQESFRRSSAGKALGAYNLHRALPELDTMVLFSSISSLIPQPNSQYAAANAVLDSLAAGRAGVGLPALSISWGAWSGSGMTLDEPVERYLQVMRAQGIPDLAADTAAGLFTWLAAAGTPHLLAADIDWSVASERLAAGGQRPFFAELAEAGAGVSGDELRAELQGLPGDKRIDLLGSRIRTMLAEILQLPAATISPVVPFGKQGLDSLMGVEFRNRLEMALGTRLPASLAWNYPTIPVLAEHLATLIGDATEEEVDGELPSHAPAAPPEAASVTALLAGLEEQSEEDILRQLRGEVV